MLAGTPRLGKTNQVVFDSEKESVHVLSNSEAAGVEFKLLGLVFDVSIMMRSAVEEVVLEAV